jgi:hypothetical protein
MVILFFLVFPLFLVDLLLQAIDIFSGVDTNVGATGGNVNNMNIFDHFFAQPMIMRAFWGIAMVAMALCIGFAIIAVIRSMGDLEGKKPIGKVLGLTMKSMLTFLLIPFMCIASINLAGLVLRQTGIIIDSSVGESYRVSLTGVMFFAGTHHGAVNYTGIRAGTANGTWQPLPGKGTVTFVPNQQSIDEGRQREKYADLRIAYQSGARGVDFTGMGRIREDFDAYRLLASGNYYIMVVVSIFAIVMLLMIMMVFLQRIYELLVMFIVSPFFVAPMVLDEGERFKKWRESFIGKIVAGFGSVITLKVFILLLPIMMSPEFVLHRDAGINAILKALLIVGGIYATYKSHTMISTLASQGGGQTESSSAAGAVGSRVAGAASSVMNSVTNPMQTVQGAVERVSNTVQKAGDAMQSAKKGVGGIMSAPLDMVRKPFDTMNSMTNSIRNINSLLTGDKNKDDKNKDDKKDKKDNINVKTKDTDKNKGGNSFKGSSKLLPDISVKNSKPSSSVAVEKSMPPIPETNKAVSLTSLPSSSTSPPSLSKPTSKKPKNLSSEQTSKKPVIPEIPPIVPPVSSTPGLNVPPPKPVSPKPKIPPLKPTSQKPKVPSTEPTSNKAVVPPPEAPSTESTSNKAVIPPPEAPSSEVLLPEAPSTESIVQPVPNISLSEPDVSIPQPQSEEPKVSSSKSPPMHRHPRYNSSRLPHLNTWGVNRYKKPSGLKLQPSVKLSEVPKIQIPSSSAALERLRANQKNISAKPNLSDLK